MKLPRFQTNSQRSADLQSALRLRGSEGVPSVEQIDATDLPGGKPVRDRRSLRGFTLVEIALALAIIGFALVAIIGVLPFGLNVQRENREETIVVQDANYFLDAIRTGARGLDDLTNYVESITNFVTQFAVVPGGAGFATNVVGGQVRAYTYNQAWLGTATAPQNVITNGARIIGLLSTPKFQFTFPSATDPVPSFITSNYVVAYVRALSGPASEKSPQTNVFVRDLSFRYRLISEVTPFDNWNESWVNFTQPGLSETDIITRSNAWRVARNKQGNLHEIRLLYRWPIKNNGDIGPSRQVFRTVVGGTLQTTNDAGLNLWFLQPGIYQTVQ
jgi:prepilin-type N-terminal cleavage/methylation domain-containing protein